MFSIQQAAWMETPPQFYWQHEDQLEKNTSDPKITAFPKFSKEILENIDEVVK